MSKIKFNQISENEIKITLSSDIPIGIAEELVKNLLNKGLTEDLNKSTITSRYFHYQAYNVNQLADNLIKSLKNMLKDEVDDADYYSPKAQLKQQRLLTQQRLDALYNKKPNNSTAIAAPKPPKEEEAPSPSTGTMTGMAPKIRDNTPGALNTAEFTGKRYAYVKKNEEDDEDDENEIEKSNYGPKDAKLYNPVDNIKRKMSNTGDKTGFGPNTNTKQYTTAKWGNSSPQVDSKTKRPGPVKTYSKEEIKELSRQRGLEKTWSNHAQFPNAEEEMAKMAKTQKDIDADYKSANQLANLVHSKSMLGEYKQPTSEEMLKAGEQIGIGTNDKVAKSQDQQWNNAINNWLTEATKPITQRFNSEEEELAYWSNLSVNNSGDDGSSGY